jgi:hypothetical protein
METLLLIAGTLKMLLKRCLQAKLVCSAKLPYLLLSLIYNLGDKLNQPGQARPGHSSMVVRMGKI